MTPAQIIADVSDCSLCRGHDEHTACLINWSYLQTWMELVEARLARLESSKEAPP